MYSSKSAIAAGLSDDSYILLRVSKGLNSDASLKSQPGRGLGRASGSLRSRQRYSTGRWWIFRVYSFFMLDRPLLRAGVNAALRRSRAVALLGPRQSGKTTLARTF